MGERMAGGVLVGYDGSEGSARALDWAADEARRWDLPLTVLHAWDAYAGGPISVPVADLRGIAEDTLNGGVERVRKAAPGVKVGAVLGRGPAAARLVEAGRDADLIVLGPRGTGGFAGLVLGSVGAQVTAHASSPVAIVRGDVDAERDPGRVVVGVDGSPATRPALATAFGEAGVRGLPLSAVVAWDREPAGDLPPLVDEADLRYAAEARLGRLMIPLRELHPGVDVTTEVVTGHPRDVLMEAASGARLLVVGSRGLGGFRGLMLGSVSHAMIHHAPCPVVVVPGSATHADG